MATLVRLNDPSKTLALEVAAKAKLYNVIVDSDKTGQALINNGQLRSRVTFIPLNKVRLLRG